MKILETERTILRELVETDAEFIVDLLNQPSFIKYIGNRGVKTSEDAKDKIENLYRKSYRENGYGLYAVELKSNNKAIGFCGFVKREELPDTDIGFALLPEYEKKGLAFETSDALLQYGKDVLHLKRVLAITTQNNESSIKLLEKLGFEFEKLVKLPHDEDELNLFVMDLV